jgi:hypothetical protein
MVNLMLSCRLKITVWIDIGEHFEGIIDQILGVRVDEELGMLMICSMRNLMVDSLILVVELRDWKMRVVIINMKGKLVDESR